MRINELSLNDELRSACHKMKRTLNPERLPSQDRTLFFFLIRSLFCHVLLFNDAASIETT
jgi:hypothetical protein